MSTLRTILVYRRKPDGSFSRVEAVKRAVFQLKTISGIRPIVEGVSPRVGVRYVKLVMYNGNWRVVTPDYGGTILKFNLYLDQNEETVAEHRRLVLEQRKRDQEVEDKIDRILVAISLTPAAEVQKPSDERLKDLQNRLDSACQILQNLAKEIQTFRA